MNWISQLTEGLANLNIKWVLLAIGIGMLVFTGCRLLGARRAGSLAWVAENVQVLMSVVVVVFLLIRPFLFQAFYIPSGSMEPTLMGPQADGMRAAGGESSGDRLLVNKLIYRLTDPQRFDIAVFKAPVAADPSEKEFIKRVVGLPGETVEVVPPRLLVDGKPAVVLSLDGTGSGISVNNPEADGVKVNGRSAELTSYSSTVRVIAAPAPRIVADGARVVVNGTTELEDPSGNITRQDGITTWGGSPDVSGAMFSINGEPRLLVVSGYSLHYQRGHVAINGRPVEEDYTKEPPRYAMAPVKLKGDEYFMMGDNRNNSNDSHHWGPLKRDRVIGRAEVLFWPVNRFRILQWWLVSLLVGLFLGYNGLQYWLTRPRRDASLRTAREDGFEPKPQAASA